MAHELQTSIIGIVWAVLLLVYNIYLLKYLDDTEELDPVMDEEQVKFRKAAVAITWIFIILIGIGLLTQIVNLLSMGRASRMGARSPMMSRARTML